jgi:NDP-sugar pyrophosphorylase family protein
MDHRMRVRDLTAAVLLGGQGSRLRPIVADRPKSLAPVRGRPFVSFILDRLAAAGVRRAILCTGHLGGQVRACLGDACGAMSLIYSHETLPLGTAGALRLALPLYESSPVLVLNGDSFCDVDLSRFVEWHVSKGARATLLLARVEEMERFGRIETRPDGSVTGFLEKRPGRGPGWINAGHYLIERDLLEEIPPGGRVSLEEEMFPGWVGRGLYAWSGASRFLDIGTPESYAAAERCLATPELEEAR